VEGAHSATDLATFIFSVVILNAQLVPFFSSSNSNARFLNRYRLTLIQKESQLIVLDSLFAYNLIRTTVGSMVVFDARSIPRELTTGLIFTYSAFKKINLLI
jgi:hypothetical protein